MTVSLAPERVVRLAGGPLAVRVVGSGPPVLLLHGSGPGTTAASAWRPVEDALAERFLLVCPDLAGFGGSPLPAAGRAGRALWTGQAIELMELLGHREYALVGHSLGGALALSVAVARPEAVARVVAIGSLGAQMSLPEGLALLWAAQPTRDDAEAVLRVIAGDAGGPVDDQAIERRLQAMEAQGGDAYAALFPEPREQAFADLVLSAAELAAIEARVLLVHGARDRVVPLEGAVALLDHLRHADLLALGGCGHAPHVERPSEVARAIGDFLEADA